ncbi:hypothetical protein NUW54_g4476 [Trametes sanguinea]|uniref:Uncharacterized protein n=1 Tax=Trametes sanguinea TaxID=158606 RepID=A0ACC1PYD8_9APHY|nr:hypothetical protein NUW54_g4476 [Trametes sanguinea]
MFLEPSSLCPAVHPSPSHYFHDPLLSSSFRPDLGVSFPLISPSQPHAASIAIAFPQLLHLAWGPRLLVTSSHPCVLPPAIPNLSHPRLAPRPAPSDSRFTSSCVANSPHLVSFS